MAAQVHGARIGIGLSIKYRNRYKSEQKLIECEERELGGSSGLAESPEPEKPWSETNTSPIRVQTEYILPTYTPTTTIT